MTVTTKARTRPAAIALTPSAEARIAALMAQAPADAIGVKLSTPRVAARGAAVAGTRRSRAAPSPQGTIRPRAQALVVAIVLCGCANSAIFSAVESTTG